MKKMKIMDKTQNINSIRISLHESRYLKIKEFLDSRFNDVAPSCVVYTCLINHYGALTEWILDNSPLKNFDGLDTLYYETLIETKATNLEAIGLHVVEHKTVL